LKKYLYPIYALPLYGLSLLPFPLLYLLSNGLRFLAFNVIGYRKKVVYQNLRNAFPNYTEAQIDTIAKNFYKHLIDVFLETFKMQSISVNQLEKHGKFVNLTVLDEIIKEKRSFVILTSHMGNWEWLPSILHLEKKADIVGIYHKLSSPFFEWFTKRMRERFGIQMITMENTLRGMLANKNKLTGTGFLSDQTPSAENAYWIQFLNQDTPVHTGAEKIAKKFDYPVVYAAVKKPKRGYYEVNLEILTMNPKETPDYYITNLFNQKLEEDIKNQPEIWLWSHRRWKHKRQITTTNN
jgi:KDO2-lipid IV(A) lauroyltransferase